MTLNNADSISPPALSYRTVWIAGMPRCGSMWCFNVARALLRDAGYRVVPESVPRDAEGMYAAGLDGMRAPAGSITVVKLHRALPKSLPRARIISPERDLRDALVSYRRFTGCGFADALAAAKEWAALCDHYAAMESASCCSCLRPKYADIAMRPAEVVAAIAAFLDLVPDGDSTARILAEFDKQAVADRIAAAEGRLGAVRECAAGPEGFAPDRAAARRDAMVVGAGGRIRAFDSATGFQSSHVSDYRDGEWRSALSADEQAEIEAELGDWLRKHGYE